MSRTSPVAAEEENILTMDKSPLSTLCRYFFVSAATTPLKATIAIRFGIAIRPLTGLTIVITGSWNVGLDGVDVTTRAFQSGLPFQPQVSSFILMVCLVFFAFTTILGPPAAAFIPKALSIIIINAAGI